MPNRFIMTVIHREPERLGGPYEKGAKKVRYPARVTFQYKGTDGKFHKTKKIITRRNHRSIKVGDKFLAVRQHSIPAETLGFEIPDPKLVKGCSWHPWWLLTPA